MFLLLHENNYISTRRNMMESVLSLYDFLRRFPSEEECFQYLVAKRWPDGFHCPRCGAHRAYFIEKHHRFQCASCRRQTSVTAGTIFHRMRQPLLTLFWAVYLIATSKKGISAMELKRKLGIKSYQTAWLLLHKIRSAMASSQLFPLTGDAEADETFIGGRRPGKRGRGAEGKIPVAAVVETHGKTMGRAYLETIDAATTENLTSFLSRNLTPGVKVTTDGFLAYGFLSANFQHVPRVRANSSDDDTLPKVHILIANLKMWLRGTYNCLPSKHLQHYLDEFIFRFNRRWKLDCIFDKLIVRCIATPSFTYADLTG
jgi:transposase-like protein